MASSINFVIAAYALTWVCLVAYATYVHRTLRRARDEYQRASRQPAGEAR
ncbi:MAG: hypothetical protein OEW77_05740 [Gemmatimonadota bacterium]|nr:hypothetical protein [Gemmatimonadota bacterium]